MKSLILSFMLIFGLAAQNHGKPINVIYPLNEPILTEEDYINDIPFDTYEIAVNAILDGDEVKLEDEAYVNDIPFDTRAIASKYLLRRMIETSKEGNVNDIPFNTENYLNEQLAARLTEKYRNEKSIYDLYETPDYIVCSYKNGVSSCMAVSSKSAGLAKHSHRKIENSEYTIIYPVNLELLKPELIFEPPKY